MIVSQMNRGLLSDSHKHSPYQRIHIEVLHFVFWLALKLWSQIRVVFLEVWNVSTRYSVIVRPLRVVHVVDVGIFCGKFPCTFLKTRILVRSCSSEFSSHVRSSLHPLATLENLTLRHFDLNLQRQVSLHFVCYEIRTLLTGCSECPRATWCTRTRRCRSACRNMRDVVQCLPHDNIA